MCVCDSRKKCFSVTVHFAYGLSVSVSVSAFTAFTARPLSLSLPLLTLSFGNRRILKLLLHTAEKDTAVSEWVSGVVNRQEKKKKKKKGSSWPEEMSLSVSVCIMYSLQQQQQQRYPHTATEQQSNTHQ